MSRLLPVLAILCLVGVLVPACQGGVSTTSSASTTSSTSTSSSSQSSGGPIGCAPPCCEDNPQFPLQRGNGCVQCNTDSDCKAIFFMSAYGLKCQPDGLCGCAVDNDCVGDADYPRCRAADASCVQCLSDADCDTTCNKASGSCIACTVDADCTAGSRGPHCSATGCGCASSADCSASLWGRSCLPGIQGGSVCGCAADTECAGSASGHACTTTNDGKQCGCSSDADCDASSVCQTTAGRCLPK